MLVAYFDCSYDSHALFDDKLVANTKDYEKNLNQYNVISLDVSSFVSECKRKGGSLRKVPDRMVKAISQELSLLTAAGENLYDTMVRFVEESGKRIVFVIDEWDAVIREAKEDPVAQEAYLHLLRSWFKNMNITPKVVACAYMTGILPIKKDGSQSFLSDFKEFTMVKPRQYGEFVGFTEEEVKKLCESRNVDFRRMKEWYDGYRFPQIGHVYNPSSVMQALENKDFDSYWVESSVEEGFMDYISKDYHGLTKTIAELIGGLEMEVDTTGFANDLTSFKSKDDVLTLLIHLGYLCYNAEMQTVRIPNEEMKLAFQRLIQGGTGSLASA